MKQKAPYGEDAVRGPADVIVLPDTSAKIVRTADLVNNQVVLCSGYDPDLVAATKKIPGARWNPTIRAWHVPLCLEAKALIELYGFNVTSRLAPVLDGELESLTVRSASLVDGRILARCPYHEELVKSFRQMGGRFDSKHRAWLLPLSTKVVAWLKDHGFAVAAEVEQALRDIRQTVETSRSAEGCVAVPGLKLELLGYQRAGVGFALQKGRVLIADEPGLGKTAQALAFLQARKDLRPALVVCPASLKLNWRAEAGRFLEDCPENEVAVLNGTVPQEVRAPISIINYDILYAWVPVMQGQVRAVILDESHAIKSRDSRRTKAVLEVARHAEAVICLTGTPLLNRPADLFTQLNLLAPQEFGSFFEYGRRYCAGRKKQIFVRGGGKKSVWDFSGASHLDELNERLRSTVMVRRLKKDVLKELPPKRVAEIPVELASPGEYLQAESEFRDWLREKVEQGIYDEERLDSALRAEAMVKVEYLKQCAARLKLASAVEWIRGFLDSGQKLVVFAHHREIVEALAKEFGRVAVVLTGGGSQDVKDAAVRRFQGDPGCRLFIGSIQAAGVGLTLTAASDVTFVEYPWRPADFDQAVDRCHRIGQANSVTAWCLVASVPEVETVDERVLKVLAAKRAVADSALDGGKGRQVDVLGTLLKGYAANPKTKKGV